MHYPWWYIPGLTAPMLIAFVAVVHVIVSHYAVGGGILIAIENQFALKTGDSVYRNYWKKHAQFFVLLTVAFGAITGVGIWWTIGLASPLATESLIRIFLFGWAIEWVFFIIEIVAAFIMYYFWSRLPAKTHIIIAWIYAIAAWISLVLITGITAFMLDSRGLFGQWCDTKIFWDAFFNLQFLPQTIVRTGGSILLAALYVLLHAATTLQKPEQSELLAKVVSRMKRPILFGAITMAIGLIYGLSILTPRVYMIIERSVLLNILFTICFGLCGILVLLMCIGPIRDSKSINVGFAASLFIFGITLLAGTEFAREAVRKPWIVDQVVLGNQILADEVEIRQKDGYLRPSFWGRVPQFSEERGAMIFMYHCNNCHALESGISAVGPLLFGETPERIKNRLNPLNEPVLSMPPWCGTDEELDDLVKFLMSVRHEKLTKNAF
ncbi:MAG: c-type cytochrome [Thermoguttaceae bacterium]